jgi:hypothetical protein
MSYASHRTRHLFFAILLTLFGLMLSHRPARGGWSADPVEVHSTTALCPLVSVVPGTQGSSIVLWQENTASGGLLRARRLLASGDLDPAWTAPLAVSDHDATRGALGTVSDDAGGGYVWWMEGPQLFLTRIAPTGTIAAGWPARGRNIGSLYSAQHRPQVVADGTGGVYVAWMSMASLSPPYQPTVRGQHLGPANTSAGGWPAGGRTLATVPDVWMTNSFGIGVAPDGGSWLAWQTTLLGDPDPGPGDLRLTRLTSAGLPKAGWTVEGISLAEFHGELLSTPGQLGYEWHPVPAGALVAVASDGADGAFVLASSLVDDGNQVTASPSLRRVDATGQPSTGWSAAGISIGGWGLPAAWDAGANASLRALPDTDGGVLAGFPMFASEFTATFGFQHRSASGASLPGGASADQRGVEVAARDDGGLWMASYKPSGATGPYEADAYIAASASDPGGSYYESKPSYYSTRYGDVGLAATGDGGAIFAWSELIDRHGVYAVRVNPAGAVTGVPPLAVAPGFRAWFVGGIGVHVQGGSQAFTLRLHDVTGREVARGSFDYGGEWIVPGTAELPSGIYFVNAMVGGNAVHARVAVVR